MLTVAYAGAPDYERDLVRVMAFLGRYGHQRFPDMEALSRRDLMMLADEVLRFMVMEGDSTRERLASASW